VVDIRVSDDGTGWYRASLSSANLFDIPHGMKERFNVRINQAKEQPDWSDWLASHQKESKKGDPSFIPISMELADFLHEMRMINRQMDSDQIYHKSITSRDNGRINSISDRYIIHFAAFPECYVPRHYLSGLRQFVRETGIALLAGVLFRELPRSVYTAPAQRCKGFRCIVNGSCFDLAPSRTRERKDVDSIHV